MVINVDGGHRVQVLKDPGREQGVGTVQAAEQVQTPDSVRPHPADGVCRAITLK